MPPFVSFSSETIQQTWTFFVKKTKNEESFESFHDKYNKWEISEN